MKGLPLLQPGFPPGLGRLLILLSRDDHGYQQGRRFLALANAVSAAKGQTDRAVRLIAATDAWRTARGTPLPAIDHGAQERSILAIRRALGPAFASAWTAGRTLSIEDAIAEATAPIPLDPGPSHPVDDPARGTQLTARELEVVRLIAAGRSNQEIADDLSIGYRTATTHVSNILTKLGIDSRTAVAAFAIRHGLA